MRLPPLQQKLKQASQGQREVSLASVTWHGGLVYCLVVYSSFQGRARVQPCLPMRSRSTRPPALLANALFACGHWA